MKGPTMDDDMKDDIEEAFDEAYGDDEDDQMNADGVMGEDEFQSVVRQAIQDAQDYIDTYIAPERERAMEYYLAKPFGNEEDGRSQVVMTDVRDTVLAMIPSLLRIFANGDRTIEFIPRGPEDVAAAEQATDLINYVFMQENNGFRVLHDAMKDGLVLKTGVLTWHKVDDKTVEYQSFSGLSPEEAALVTSDPGVMVDRMEEAVDMMTGAVTVSMDIRRMSHVPRYVVECIPPEQFLIDPDATSLDDAIYVGRRKLATVSELVAMGYEREEILEHAGMGGFEDNMEANVRNAADDSSFGFTRSNDKATERVFYVESYIRVDRDGDGVAELHKVCSIGDGAYVLYDEVVQDVPFSLLCPDPTPHTVFGQSVADHTMDIQLQKSSIMRGALDSLAQSIHPRTVVIEGMVNLDDVMNVETGAIIRARQIGAVQPLSEPFVGQPALGVLGYLDEIKTQRTGISRATQGLDADALQSTTRSAVQAQLSSSQERIEMIARLFADGLKRMFGGLLKLVVQHQDKPKIIRLRGDFVPIDPRGWDAAMDVTINIALGRGSDEQRMMFLGQLIGMQKEALAAFGPMNPLTDLAQLRTSLAELTKLAGFQDPSRFWKDITPETMQAFMQATQQQPKPDPAELLAQVEAEKIKADIVISAAKQELERQKAIAAEDRMRDQMYVDAVLKAAEIQARFGAAIDMQLIKSEVDARRAELETMFAAAAAPQQAPAPAPAPQMGMMPPPMGVQ